MKLSTRFAQLYKMLGVNSMRSSYYRAFREVPTLAGNLASSTMGIFDPLNLAVSYHPTVWTNLGKKPGAVSKVEANPHNPLAQAWATALHETIHWLQTVGTSWGFLSSLTMAAQFQRNWGHLASLARTEPPRKPIFVQQAVLQSRGATSERYEIGNIVVNNWMDIEFSYCIRNNQLHAHEIFYDAYFESLAHSHKLHYSSVIELLRYFDKNGQALEDPEDWVGPFNELEKRQTPGHFYGSSSGVAPFGAFHIQEAQARFLELRYRMDGLFQDWSDFERLGLLTDPYTVAFAEFLRITKRDFTEAKAGNLIDLFSVVCDISLNPSVGYPEAMNPELIVDETNPGWRFLAACYTLVDLPGIEETIVQHEKVTYDEVAGEICLRRDWKSPTEVAQSVVSLFGRMSGSNWLSEGISNGEFSDIHTPVAYLASQHMRAMRDRIVAPEFFCWLPKCTKFPEEEESPYSKLIEELLILHRPPFQSPSFESAAMLSDHLVAKWPSDAAWQFLTNYVRWQLLYDVVRQWISDPGPFKLKYDWLDPKADESTWKPWIEPLFEQTFGCMTSDIEIIA